MRTVISLNNDWLFDISPANLEPPFLFSPEKTQAICLPHTWNAEDGQSGENYRRACCAYYRALHVPAQANGRFYLEFQAANTVCRAYLNDKFLGEHRGGYSTFRFDITDFCTPGGADRLTVLVDNSECHDVNPLSGDFTIFGGLYRDVNLICVPYTHFDLSYYGTQGVLLTPILDENGTRHLSIETHLINGDNAKVCYEVTAPDGSSAARAETAGSAPNTEILLPNPVLWNGLRAPAMYTCTARVTGADGQTDEVVLTFGLRSFFVDPEKGFFLNGEQSLCAALRAIRTGRAMGTPFIRNSWKRTCPSYGISARMLSAFLTTSIPSIFMICVIGKGWSSGPKFPCWPCRTMKP